MYTVQLDGKEYPFYFGTSALDKWQRDNGREEMEFTEFDDMLGKLRYQTDFMYYGLKAGAAMEKVEFEMTKDEMLMMLDRTPGAFLHLMGKIMLGFQRTFIGGDADKAERAIAEYIEKLNPSEVKKDDPSP